MSRFSEIIKSKVLIWIAVLSLISGILISFFYLKNVLDDYSVVNREINLESSASIGDFIGGVVGTLFSLIGVIFLFITLNEQREFTQLERFESKFFELLKLHKENVNELKYKDYQGREVFTEIKNDFYSVIDVILANGFIRRNRLDEQDLANISFCIMYFGFNQNTADVLENKFFKKYYDYTNDINKCIKELEDKKRIPINGHQNKLSHYFRHLRRTILFVHRNEKLSQNQKKDYVRFVRAQLSTDEQILLFFHSISDLGLKWELENRNHEKTISDYSLIRNIPLGSVYGFRPNRYYPELKMEDNFEIRL
ncbi:MAG: hypothetical protein RL264_588 [Bacteroidota bacterium]|jgi:hypothetical protein